MRTPPDSLGSPTAAGASRRASDRTDDELQGYSRQQADELMHRWDELQAELTALSTRSRRVIARDSGHMVHLRSNRS